MDQPSAEALNGAGDGALNSLKAFRGRGTILVFGLPRSGTTWLGKIFDSHPDVLYRNEPDRLDRGAPLPDICPIGHCTRYLEPARAYFNRLKNTRTLDAAGQLPHFSKSFRSRLASLSHESMLIGLRTIRRFSRGAPWARLLPVPDLIDRSGREEPRVVIKSVSLGRAGLIAEAWPESPIVVIMRHPCAQVESEIRGLELGYFSKRNVSSEFVSLHNNSSWAGMTAAKLDALPYIEQLAWRWAIWNQYFLDQLGKRDQVRIVNYDDLARHPEALTRELFAFAGLAWHPQVASFITMSTSRDESNRYFEVYRNPASTIKSWRDRLSLEEQKRIMEIAQRVTASQLFLRQSGLKGLQIQVPSPSS